MGIQKVLGFMMGVIQCSVGFLAAFLVFVLSLLNPMVIYGELEYWSTFALYGLAVFSFFSIINGSQLVHGRRESN